MRNRKGNMIKNDPERKVVSRKDGKKFLFYLRKDLMLYLFLIPVILYYVLFKYWPMYGLTIAFKDYNVFKGITGSAWNGLTNWVTTFSNQWLWKSIRNTLGLNLITLAVEFPLTIILSLMLNEIRHVKFKKITQSILYLPHFVSWVVVAGIVRGIFAQEGGAINGLLNQAGISSVPFMSNNGWWIFTYVVSNVWKGIGWGTIIYLAALTSVDESLYEAAYIDGATKFQRTIYITIPMIKPVMVTMLILSVSKMMNIGLDAPLLLGNNKVMEVSQVISTYIYRLGIEKAQYSVSTVIGLFQSVVNIIILLAADFVAKLIGEEGIL